MYLAGLMMGDADNGMMIVLGHHFEVFARA